MKNYTMDRVVWLALFTIIYNLAEGVISLILGLNDETLTLAGFGVDSFVEVISGLGVLQMAVRIRKHPESSRSEFEKRALLITGTAFYLLTAGLLAGAVYNLMKGHKPETTVWGVVISVISIAVMYWLYRSKVNCGRSLQAEPVLADANCTLVCIYMSVVLLVSSLVYELTGIGWIDTLGALGLAWFSFSEGREAFEKREVSRE
jgi:divalent metal cation (Fe/Co/Zn/Cd) transporter